MDQLVIYKANDNYTIHLEFAPDGRTFMHIEIHEWKQSFIKEFKIRMAEQARFFGGLYASVRRDRTRKWVGILGFVPTGEKVLLGEKDSNNRLEADVYRLKGDSSWE